MKKNKYIIVGAEDNSDSGDQKGIYFALGQEGINNFTFPSIDKNYKTITFKGAPSTPLLVKSTIEGAIALTRNHISCIQPISLVKRKKHLTPLADIQSKLLESLISSSADGKEKGKRIIGFRTATGSMDELDNHLLFSLYSFDKKKNQAIDEGYLFYSPTGRTEALTLLDKVSPTGKAIFRDFQTILVPQHRQVFEYRLTEGNEPSLQRSLPDEPLEGDILSVASLDQFVLAADRKGGFFLNWGENNSLVRQETKIKDFNPFTEENVGKYLPSEATSVALAKYGGEYYALFGMSDGKLSIYKINKITDGGTYSYELQHHKSVNFFSLEKVIAEAGKDNYIRELRVKDGQWVGFIMGNLFIHVSVSSLLNHEEGIDPLKEKIKGSANFIDPKKPKQQKEYRGYLQELKNTYDLDIVLAAPHRLTSWDYLEVNTE